MMKRNMKKLVALTMCTTMLGSAAVTVSAEEASGYQVNEELAAAENTTLNVFGAGVFTTTGADGSIDLISGVEMPGYNVLLERWNELYPNCEVVIDAIPWDNWQANITTACLGGDVDVIAHGATMIDLTEDLAPYIEAEEGYMDQIYATAPRITTEDMSKYKISGICIRVTPMVVWLDKEKFENFGVELPDSSWTYDDMLALAEQLTGTDPVTGEQSYGIQYYDAGGQNSWANHMLWANSLGADIFQYKTNVTDTVVDYTCEESVQAFQMVHDLAQYASPEVREGVGVTKVFDGTNTWAMVISESMISEYQKMVAAGTQDRYICMPCPLATAGRYEGTPTPYVGENNLAIYNGSDNKEWAWEFIKFMTTDEVALQWITDVGNIPNNVNSLEYVRDMFNDQINETLDTVLSSMPENFAVATNYVYNNVSFGPTQTNLVTAVDNVINEYMTPEEAAQFMQDTIDEYVASVK